MFPLGTKNIISTKVNKKEKKKQMRAYIKISQPKAVKKKTNIEKRFDVKIKIFVRKMNKRFLEK